MATLREELELDISTAEGQIDRVGSDLTQVAQQFRNELGDALSILSEVTIEDVDASAVEDSIGEALDDAESDPLDLEADLDTSEAEAELEGLSDEPVEVPVDADTTEAEAQIEELSGEDIEIGVDVDSGDAEQELDGLSQSTEGLGSQSEQTSESTAGLGGAIGGMSARATAGIAAVAGIAIAAGKLFTAGLENVGSLDAFNQRLGESAIAVEAINVGGLSETLGELAQRTGSSDEALRNAVATQFEFAKAAGATDAEAEKFAQTVATLSIRASVLNPALGDAGGSADALGRTLGRGGPRLARFGVELDRNAILARALQDNIGATETSLTDFQLQAAGAAIVSEELGDSLATDINEGAESARIEFESFQQVFGDTLEELGKPLIVPVIDLLNESLPVIIPIFETVADIAGALLPVLSSLFTAIEPFIEAIRGALAPLLPPLSEALTELVDAAAPGLAILAESLGEALIAVVEAILPLLPLLEGLGLAIGAVAEIAASVVDVLTEIIGVVGGITGAIGGALNLLPNFGGEIETAADSSSDLENALFGTVENIDDLAEAIAGANDNLVDFLEQGQSDLVDEFSSELREAGISSEGLAGALGDTDIGAERLAKSLAEAGVEGATFEDGQIALEGRAFALVKSFQEEQQALQDVGQATLDNLVFTGELSDEIANSAVTLNTATDGEVNYQQALIDVNAELANQTTATEDQIAAQEAENAILETTTTSLLTLTEAIIAGEAGAGDFATAAEELGLDLATVEQFADIVTRAVDEFVTSATTALPKVSSAADDLGDAFDPQKLLDNLAAQTEAIVNFETNIRLLLAFGLDNLAALALEKGPEFTEALVNSFAVGREGLALELETGLEESEAALDSFAVAARDEFAPQFIDALAVAGEGSTEIFNENLFDPETGIPATTEAAIGAATAVTAEEAGALALVSGQLGISTAAAYDENLDLETPTGAAVEGAEGELDAGAGAIAGEAGAAADEAEGAFAEAFDLDPAISTAIEGARTLIGILTGPVARAAFSSGLIIGNELGQGIAQGLSGQISAITAAAVRAVREAEVAARSEAGAASPSQLFADLGEDLSAGIALGLEDGAAAVVREAEGIVAAAAQGAAGVAAAAPIAAGVAAGGAGGGIEVGVVNVSVSLGAGVSEAEATAAGRAVADGLSDQLTALAQRNAIVGTRITGGRN